MGERKKARKGKNEEREMRKGKQGEKKGNWEREMEERRK